MSNLFSTTENKTTTNNQSQNTAPWSSQIPYLTDAFAKAQNNYNTGAGSLYSGDQVAQYTPDQLNAFKQMFNYGFGSNAANTSTAVGTNLANTGSAGLSAAMQQLLAFKPTGGASDNVATAGLYADNPYLSGQVDAALRDATRYANEVAIPGVRTASAATGNVNSNTIGRGGIAEGIIARGLSDKAADVSAGLRGDAYSTGLQLAEQGRQFDTNAILDALKSTGTLGATSAASGVDALSSGISQQGSLFDIANSGAAGQQAANQAAIDNALAKSEYPADRLNSLLAQYFATIGNPNYGGTQTSTGTTMSTDTKNKSTAEGIAGIVGSLAGLFSGKK